MNAQGIRRIAVIGAGLMGHGIAQEFAQAGYDVTICDRTEREIETALSNIKRNLKLLAEHGLASSEEIPDILSRIKGTIAIGEAAADADFVVEAAFEDLAVKQQIFRDLDAASPPHAILASNTSSFPVRRYAGATRRPERVLGTHYFNPPHLVPLVEVIKGDQTAEETVETTVELMARVGKKPAVVRRDVPGSVGNRLQAALFREALHIVEEGIATPEDVDTVVKYSFGRRMGVMGPFEQTDIIGADLRLAIQQELLPEIARTTTPSPILADQVRKGDLGMKSGRGFYTWTHESMEAVRERIALALINILKGERGDRRA